MAPSRVFYGWIVVAASAAIVCVGMGALFSLGVFLKPMAETMGWSRGAISTVALLNWIAMGLGSFVWGALSDRLGTRAVAVAGGLLLGLGLVLSSQVQALWQLNVTFGLMVGFAVGAFYAPLTSTATKWFTVRRGLAVALVSSGIGVGILAIAPLARGLTSAWDWRVALLVIGDLAWLIVVPAALLIRETPGDVGAAAMGGAARVGRDYSTRQVLSAPQFWAIALTHFACCAAHSGPIFHMVTHATDQGIGPMAAATALGVSGFASIAGRVGGGLLADRFGAKSTLLAGLALQAAMIVLYLFVRELGPFYVLAIVFGVSYGGVMPLYALVTREYFGEKVMGAAYGGVFLVSTLGMGLGSFAGGVLYDRLGSYTWLYAGSFAIGAAAVLLALTFRTPRALPLLAPAR
ncbi:MAG: MFS transporter [Candidatus Rokuibacteriota bacterium]|nr:MAG: MFS transporter [Candidatus Rokubacteria bacterium]